MRSSFPPPLPPIVIQLLLYLIVGGLSSVLDVGGFWVLLRMGMAVMAATVLSFVAATLLNYVLSYTLAFTRGRYSRGSEIVRFWLVSMAGLTINTLAVWLLTQFFHVHPLLAKVAAVMLVLIWNFLGRRLFVFHKEVPTGVAAALGLQEAPASDASTRPVADVTADGSPS